jgi:iron-sulfur cluster repair protein YtfE (RIC family)
MSQPETAHVEAPPLREPLKWFFAEHARHRRFCRLLGDLAAAPAFEEAPLQRAIDFLRDEVPQHFADEDQDLFPVLRRRALPEDELEHAFEILAADHRNDQVSAARVLEGLQSCLAAGRPASATPALKLALQEMASHELRHLALENAVVLPIARRRLTTADLRKVSAGLAARGRGPSAAISVRTDPPDAPAAP